MSNALGLIAPQYACPADWFTGSVNLGGVLPVIQRTGTYLADQTTLDSVVTAALAVGSPVVYLTVPPMGFTDARTVNPNAYYPTPALIAEQIANARSIAQSTILPAVGGYTYNTDGTIASGPYGETYTYNTDGTLHTVTYNGVTRTFVYNTDGTIASVA